MWRLTSRQTRRAEAGHVLRSRGETSSEISLPRLVRSRAWLKVALLECEQCHQVVERRSPIQRVRADCRKVERLGRIPLLIVDEVGNIPFDPEAAALFFALISSRYERRSLIVSSNKTFSAWAEIFGDPVAVAALVDPPPRRGHRPQRAKSYRLCGKREEVLTGEEEC